MPKLIIYILFIITTTLPAFGQPDSSRVLRLIEQGKQYLIRVHVDRKMDLTDSAIGAFDHAVRLSDTLQLTHLKCESMSFEGESYIAKSYVAEGKKRFFDAAAIYHAKGDIQGEARTWFWLARKLNWQGPDLDEIETFFNSAVKLYRQAHNLEREAAARTSLADFLSWRAKYALAEKELLQALDLLHQLGNARVHPIYLTLSAINRYRGSYDKALFYATKCVEIADQNKDTDNADMCYGELALVCDELGRAEESSYWYRKTLDHRIEHKKDRIILNRTAGFLIRQLIKQNKSKAALALMDSLGAAYPARNSLEKGAIAQNYAYCFDGLRRSREAEKYFLAAIAYYNDAAPEQEIISIANMDMGRFYLQHGQYKKAHNYLDTALVYRSGLRLLDVRDLFQMLYTADSALGNYPDAVSDLKQYQFLNDSIFNERKSRQIEELTIQYETEKKEKSILLLKKERLLILGVATLLIVIVGLLINHARLKQRTNRKLQVQQKQIEKKNQSLQHLVAEKEWLVREIHHRVKNNFHMVMGLLRTQSEYLQGEEAIQAVTESQQRIQSMSLVHQRLYQSDNLSAINMEDYIHELVDCLKDSFHTGSRIRFNLWIDPVKLNVSHCIPLGLILNEAITNSLKHAFLNKKEGVIDVSLKWRSQDHLLLSIKDNGVGLSEAFDRRKKTSMGMKLMHGLSDDIDAKFQIINNNGTEIVLDFKL